MRTWATIAPVIPRFPVTAFLVVALSTLGPLAHARPPDPTWIGGFYDAADGDDAILAVTAMESAPPLIPVVDVEPHAIGLGRVGPFTGQTECSFALAAPAVRAPPSA